MTIPHPQPHGIGEPSDWVIRFAHLIPSNGTVLDVACGQGRHARYLSGRGHRVSALDRDPEALRVLGSQYGIDVHCADIESGPWPFPDGNFDALVVTNYLHRPLFPVLFAALRSGGVLIYETFARGNEFHGRPANPDFLLTPGELLEQVPGNFVVAAFEQGTISSPKPAVIQRLCAIRADTLLDTI